MQRHEVMWSTFILMVICIVAFPSTDAANQMRIFPEEDILRHPGRNVTVTCKLDVNSTIEKFQNISWDVEFHGEETRKIPESWQVDQYIEKDELISTLSVPTTTNQFEQYTHFKCSLGSHYAVVSILVRDPPCKMTVECLYAMHRWDKETQTGKDECWMYCKWRPADPNCRCDNCVYNATFHQLPLQENLITDLYFTDPTEHKCGDGSSDDFLLDPFCEYHYPGSEDRFKIKFTMTSDNAVSTRTEEFVVPLDLMPGGETKIGSITNETFAKNRTTNLKIDIKLPFISSLCKYSGVVEYKLLSSEDEVDIYKDNRRHNAFIESYWTRYKNYSVSDNMSEDTSQIWHDSITHRIPLVYHKATLRNLKSNSYYLIRAGLELFDDIHYSDGLVSCHEHLFYTSAEIRKTEVLPPLPTTDLVLVKFHGPYKMAMPHCDGGSTASNAIIMWQDFGPQSTTNVISKYEVSFQTDDTKTAGKTIEATTHCMVLDGVVNNKYVVNVTAVNNVGATSTLNWIQMKNQPEPADGKCELILISVECTELTGQTATFELKWTTSHPKCGTSIKDLHLQFFYWQESNTKTTYSQPRELNAKQVAHTELVTIEIKSTDAERADFIGIDMRLSNSSEINVATLRRHTPYRFAFSGFQVLEDNAILQHESIVSNSLFFAGETAPKYSQPTAVSLNTKNSYAKWEAPSVRKLASPINSYTVYYATHLPCDVDIKQFPGSCSEQIKEVWSVCQNNVDVSTTNVKMEDVIDNQNTGDDYIGVQQIGHYSDQHLRTLIKLDDTAKEYYVWVSFDNNMGQSRCSDISITSITHSNTFSPPTFVGVLIAVVLVVIAIVAVITIRKKLLHLKVPKPYLQTKFSKNQSNGMVSTTDTSEEVVEKLIVGDFDSSSTTKYKPSEVRDDVFEDINDNNIVFTKARSPRKNSYVDISTKTDEETHKRFSNFSYVSNTDSRYIVQRTEMDSGVWSSPSTSSDSKLQYNEFDYVQDEY